MDGWMRRVRKRRLLALELAKVPMLLDLDVRGLAPETQVELSRYSVTIELCDSYCLGIGDYRVVQWRSLYMGFG